MATDQRTDRLYHRAKKWVKRNRCALPIDLYTEMVAAGMDAGAIEDRLLYAAEDPRENN